ncbi:hypothetical protein SORBI_3008G102850 [Sorghum bicolor]|uniref:Uncharacterized protein n=1 Tax=Sorghum bicolor TaxID=4558 RepID=A0A1Z5R6U3_SORBI|nr:hypothetical protein SORBI_3008G102850 [Sorghum bicolor]
MDTWLSRCQWCKPGCCWKQPYRSRPLYIHMPWWITRGHNYDGNGTYIVFNVADILFISDHNSQQSIGRQMQATHSFCQGSVFLLA